MSITVMSQVWAMDDLDPYEKLVLLALADHANDEGECYPSIRRLRKRTGMGERGTQNVIKRLCERGLLNVDYGQGRGGSNLYRVTLDPRTECAPRTRCTPAPDAPPPRTECAPRTRCTPAPDAPPPRTECTTPPHPVHPTPAPGAPKPSRTTKEPSLKNEAREARDLLREVASTDAVDSFISFRRKLRKPVTVTAAQRLSKTLSEITANGGDADDALGLCEERGWQAIKADWYFKEKAQSYDNRTGNSGRSATGASGSRSSLFDAAAAVAARRSGRA